MSDETSRRDFLKKSIFILGGLITAGMAVPAATYFLSPIWKKDEEDWIEVGMVADIAPDSLIGQPVKVEFVRRKKDGWDTVEEHANAWVVTSDRENFTVGPANPHGLGIASILMLVVLTVQGFRAPLLNPVLKEDPRTFFLRK